MGNSIQILRRQGGCIDQFHEFRALCSLAIRRPQITALEDGPESHSDPVYEAGDTSSGTPVFGFVTSNTARIINNRDFFAEVSQSAQTSPTSPFNGTVGTGFGTLANTVPLHAHSMWVTGRPIRVTETRADTVDRDKLYVSVAPPTPGPSTTRRTLTLTR